MSASPACRHPVVPGQWRASRPWLPALLCVLTGASCLPLQAQQQQPYYQCVCTAAPELYWNFSAADFRPLLGELGTVTAQGQPQVLPVGPAAPEFPLFEQTNPALRLDGRSWLTIDDPGADSILDFAAADSISIEAWVRLDALEDGQQIYIIGKGRTQNPGQQKDNQNYALRVRGMGGLAHISFLYRSADQPATTDADGKVTAAATPGEFHRWNSQAGFEPDGLWHHIAVSHTFGGQQPPRAWVDGQPTDGSWDMGEKTFSRAPLVDDDQLWIGSAMGGNTGCTLQGAIDEIAIFRRTLTDREISERFQTTRPTAAIPELASDQLPDGSVVLDIREAVSLTDPWARPGSRITQQWQQPAAAVAAVPRKYIAGGLIGDRTNPYVLRMRLRLDTPDTATQFLIRSRSHARLLIDGQVVATLEQARYASDGHEEVREPAPPLYPHMHPLPMGDQEAVVPVTLEAGTHLIELEAMVGGKNMRVEASETLVAVGSAETGFMLLGPGCLQSDTARSQVGLDEASWRAFAAAQRQWVATLDQQERARQDVAAAAYWTRRHELARQLAGITAETAVIDAAGVDQLLLETLQRARLEPTALVDDLTFLKRLTLNTIGVIPSAAETAWFLSRPAESRRSQAIDRFLDDPRWADHWVSYWQDVLAENPGILKPELNNSGPFRWWIYESFLDNKPSDRFATELVMMRGSRLGGGPAGFAMASQNDVPLAERALVLSTAFNARDMKCARCHDSPVNSITQQQLFEMAAMLNRAPLKLPATSTVPKGPNGERSILITVSLEPGAVIQPAWPFHDKSLDPALRDALLQNPADTREQAALHLTHPVTSDFAEVMVNRLWTRLFGQGLLPAPDNWDGEPAPQQPLLEALARQHIASGYDLKATARLILNTQAFQRQVAPAEAPVAQHFGAQSVRRMTAEQMVDSLYAATGKQFDAEMLTLDQEGRRPDSSFLNLGQPTRAWQFCSLSNERDRPALALPRAQSIFDLLTVFGWRDSRPQTLTQREEDATVLQPLTLANGTAGRRLVQLSDGAVVTELAVAAASPRQLTEQLFQHILTRQPTADELELFSAELEPGFDTRLVPGATAAAQPVVLRNPVSWSNHLHPRATELKQALEVAVRAGDPPTGRLTEAWRVQAEDVLWVLLNSPEFAFVP